MLVVIVSLLSLVTNALLLAPISASASTNTWDFGTNNTQYDYDGSKLTLASDGAKLTNPGAATGASVNLNPGTGVKSDAAADFSAANKEYLTIPSNSSLQTGDIDFEIGGWVKFNSIGGTQMVAGKADSSSGSNTEYRLTMTNSKFAIVVFKNETNTTLYADTFGVLSTGIWYFVRAWHDSVNNKLKIQVNGGVIDEVNYSTGVNSTSTAFNIGASANQTVFFDGQIDSAYFTKRISTSAEATALYNSGNGRIYSDLTAGNGLDTFKSNLTSWWNLNEESGTRFDSVDASKNHLTAAAAKLIQPATYGSELLANPGFETVTGSDFGSWNEVAGTGAVADEGSLTHSGSHAVKLTGGTTDSTYINQVISLSAGQSCQFSLWTRGDGTHSGRYTIYAAGSNQYLQSNGTWSGAESTLDTNITGTSYALITREMSSTPAGTTGLSVILRAPLASGGIAYFDDVSVKQITTASLLNGGFEAAGAGGADVFESWSEITAGTSTVNDETVAPYYGAHAARLDIDASTNAAGFSQNALTVNRKYKVTAYAKVNDTTGNPCFKFQNNSLLVGSDNVLTTSYAQYTAYFTAGAVDLTIARSTNSASKSIYIDSITLESIGPLAAAGIAAGVSQDANFAAQLNGTSQYFNYTGTALDPGTNDFTVAGSFYLDSMPSGSAGAGLISAGTAGDANQFIWIYVTAGGALWLQFNDGSGTLINSGSSGGLVSPGSWYNFTITFDRDGNAVLYLNGVSVKTIAISSRPGSVAPGNLLVGRYAGSAANYFPGRIDNVTFWKRLLTDDEKTFLFNSGKGRQYAELAGTSLANNVTIISGSTLNGNFETAGTGGQPFGSWTKGESGSSTVNVETSQIHSGTKALRMDVDSSNNGVQVFQNTTTVGKRYKITFWGKANVGTPSMTVTGTVNYLVQNLTTTWTQYSAYFTADNATLYLKRGVAASSSIYIDDVTLEEVPLISFWEFDNKANLGIDSVTSSANNLTNNGTVTQTYGVNYNEGSVAKWLDQSGNAVNFTQPTLTKRPAYDSIGINNVPALQFDGVDDALVKTGDQIGTGDVTVFAVIKSRANGGGGTGRIITNGQAAFVNYGSTKLGFTPNGGSNYYYSANGSITDGTTYVVAVTRTSAGVVNFYINGALSGTADQSTGTPAVGSDTYIGNYAAGDRAFDGWIGPVIVQPSIMGNVERNQIERTLGAKYGITVATQTTPAASSSVYPSIATKAPLNYSSLTSFTPNLAGDSSGTLRYQLSNDSNANNASSTWYWWNGSAWAAADGNNAYQSNTALEVNQHLAAFTSIVSPSWNFKWKTFFVTDGIDNPHLSSINLDYISDTAPPDRPVLSSAKDSSGGSVTLTTDHWYSYGSPSFTWAKPADNANDHEIATGVAGYLVYFGTDNTANIGLSNGVVNIGSNNGAFTWQNTVGETETFTNSQTLTNGQTYYLKVIAVDSGGNPNYSATSSDYNLFVYKYDNDMPAPIDHVNVTQVGCSAVSSFDFTWSASTDTTSGIDHYEYKVGVAGNVHVTSETAVSGIAPERENENVFYVRPVDAAGNALDTWQSVVFCSIQNIVITNGPTYSNTQSTLTVDFETSRQATTRLEVYDEKNNKVAEKASDQLALTHSLSVSGLVPDTTYSYKVFFRDQNNNEGSSNTYDVKTNLVTLNHSTSNNITSDLSVLTVVFETSLPTTARVEIYDFDSGEKVGESSSQDSVLNHHVAINGLISGKAYKYRIFYTDQENNNYTSNYYIFRTETVGIIDKPEVKSGPSSLTVTWLTNQPTTGQVEIKDGDTYREPQGHTDMRVKHAVNLLGLKSDKPYQFRILWEDASGKNDTSVWYDANTAASPSVKDLKAEVISPTSILVSWQTNYASSDEIEYGIDSFGSKVAIDGSATSFSRKLENLTAGKLYQIRIKAATADGAEFTSIATVNTPPLPSITDFNFEPVVGASASTYKFIWHTNIETSSALYYRVKGGSEYKSTAAPDMVKDHELTVGNMEDQSIYEVYATGRDQFGNEAKSDVDTIETPLDSRPPKVKNLTIEVKATGFGTTQKAQLVATWETDEPASSQLEYALGISGTEYANTTKEDQTLSTSHVVIASELDPSKIYHLRAVSKDRAGNKGTSEDTTVITGKVQQSVIDIIMNSLERSLGWIFRVFK